MSKSNTRVILGLALTLAGGALIFAGPASAQSLYGYVANGENAGGSVAERAALYSAVQPNSVVNQSQAAAPVRTLHSSAMHTFSNGMSHHADPDQRIVAQLVRDCPDQHW